MPRSLSKFGQNVNITFVREVEKYPCLYNYTLDEYSKRDAVDAAWKKVAKASSETVRNCKEKWKNLRTVFVRKQKVRPGGSSRRLPYYLNAHMQFILPFVKVQNRDEVRMLPSPGDCVDTILSSDSNEEDQYQPSEPSEEVEDISEVHIKQERDEDKDAQPFTVVRLSKKSEAADEARNSKPEHQASIGKEWTGKREMAPNKMEKDFPEYFQEKQNRTSQQPDSARKTFLLSLVPEVESMTDIQFRKFRRHVLDDIDNVLN